MESVRWRVREGKEGTYFGAFPHVLGVLCIIFDDW